MLKRTALLIISGLFLFAHANAGVTLISSCPSTGIILSQPGQYHLSQDLDCSGLPLFGGGSAITITGPDVELHFDGHTMTGPSATIVPSNHGVRVQGANASIIGSGTISNFVFGILVDPGANGARIVNMTVTHNRAGIEIRANDCTVLSTTADENGSGIAIFGINVFGGGRNNLIRSSQANSNSGFGIGAAGDAVDNLIQANKAHNNGQFDLGTENCNSATWKSNQFDTSFDVSNPGQPPSCIQ
jgi:hypothetical protein